MSAFFARLAALSIVEWVQVASALGTVIAAVVAAIAARAAVKSANVAQQQLPEIQKQVEAANTQAFSAQEQVELAREATAHAVSATREAVRARADAQAPRVVMAVEMPAWPPWISTPGTEMYEDGQASILDKGQLPHATQQLQEIYLSDHGQSLMWFKGEGHLVNEGSTAARVKMLGHARFKASTTGKYLGLYPLVVTPFYLGTVDDGQVLLPPGTAIAFDWAVSAPVRDWAEKSTEDQSAGGLIEASSWSMGGAGILDHIRYEFGSQPFAPGKGGDNHWTLLDRDNTRSALVYLPTKRRWLFEEYPEWAIDSNPQP